MEKLDKSAVALNGLLPALLAHVERWQPGALATELKYRDSLIQYLRDSLPSDCRVEREYRHGGTTADVYVHWKGLLFSGEVFLELKVNLQKRAVFDRLVGQIENLDPEHRLILAVLIGDTDPALLQRLRDRYKDDGLSDNGVAIAVLRS
jgi:hypothetical protein